MKHDADAIQKQVDKLGDDIRGAQYGSYLVVLVLALLYLVPATAITGHTLGMRGRRIRVVRVDGSPVGWYGALVRFLHPDRASRSSIPTIGPLLGLGLVLWGYRDANGQGIHDKLAQDDRRHRRRMTANRERRWESNADDVTCYAFEEGSKEQKFLLGGKGANLAEMTNLGLPVPPGFTITTEACNAYMAAGDALPDGLDGRGRRGARARSRRRWASGSATPSTRCSCRCARARRSRCRG